MLGGDGQVVPVDHFVVVLVAQNLFDLRGLQSHDLPDLVGGVVDQPLGDCVSRGVDAADRVPEDEIPLDPRNTGRKEALAVPKEGLFRPVVDEETAA